MCRSAGRYRCSRGSRPSRPRTRQRNRQTPPPRLEGGVHLGESSASSSSSFPSRSRGCRTGTFQNHTRPRDEAYERKMRYLSYMPSFTPPAGDEGAVLVIGDEGLTRDSRRAAVSRCICSVCMIPHRRRHAGDYGNVSAQASLPRKPPLLLPMLHDLARVDARNHTSSLVSAHRRRAMQYVQGRRRPPLLRGITTARTPDLTRRADGGTASPRRGAMGPLRGAPLHPPSPPPAAAVHVPEDMDAAASTEAKSATKTKNEVAIGAGEL